MSSAPLPLLALFDELRRAGLPLGTGEYLLLVRALRGGYGLADRAALRRLCHTLWTHSLEEQQLLDYHFDQLLSQPPPLQPILLAKPRRLRPSFLRPNR